MRPEDVIKLVNADPFTPFRIAIRDGRMFDVLNTSMIKVGRERVFLFTPHPRLVVRGGSLLRSPRLCVSYCQRGTTRWTSDTWCG